MKYTLFLLTTLAFEQDSLTQKYPITFSGFIPDAHGVFLNPSYRFTSPRDSVRVYLNDECFYTKENIYVAVNLIRLVQLWDEYTNEKILVKCTREHAEFISQKEGLKLGLPRTDTLESGKNYFVYYAEGFLWNRGYTEWEYNPHNSKIPKKYQCNKKVFEKRNNPTFPGFMEYIRKRFRRTQ